MTQAQEMMQRAISRAQITKSGHVYIISNIGSFGENVFKVGMTRRLEPLDRVKELGDASVPFSFDVHAMIYSDNAPELENNMHKDLSEYQVNKMNSRKEFFKVDIKTIEDISRKYYGDIVLTKIADAKEFRQTLAFEESKEGNVKSEITRDQENKGQFKFDCEHCGQGLEADKEWRGMQMNCPSCENEFTVPTI